ncbi:EF-P 5-aminopentanol modification-associated protein YfmF [Cytobacillus sp. Hm23]
MSLFIEQERKINGLRLHTIETEKFKTNTILMKWNAPLQKQDATLRALLPHVLQSGTRSLPSVKQLRSHLDDLYGATFDVDLAKKGEQHVISFKMEVANEKFLSDQTPLLQKAMQLFSEVIFAPYLEGNHFSDQIIEKEKRALKQRIQAVYDDKMRYANYRLVQEMCKDEPYSLHVNGELDEVDNITSASLYQYYERVLSEDEIDLYVIGSVNSSQIEQYVSNFFSFSERNARQSPKKNTFTVEKVNEIIEKQDVRQGKLNIGYRTKATYADKEYFALQVFNGIFGGFSHSKLFINVREKASLAYYAASRLESHKGLLMVMSGIDVQNYDQAVNIIKEQMSAMKQGDFTDQELAQTKAVIKNQVLETIDHSRGLVEVLYHNVASNINRSIDEWLDGIDGVTKEEIIAVAQDVQLDTIYFLTGMEASQA